MGDYLRGLKDALVLVGHHALSGHTAAHAKISLAGLMEMEQRRVDERDAPPMEADERDAPPMEADERDAPPMEADERDAAAAEEMRPLDA